MPPSVRLVKGYFEDTLGPWSKENPGEIAFVHIDCDLYSSTVTIFREIGHRFRKGTALLFDDYFNFPGWQEDGHKAFNEYLPTSGLSVSYIGYGFKELAVKLT